MNEDINRRHVDSRGKKWASMTAKWLSQRDVTPNQISWTSLFFAMLAAVFLFRAGRDSEWWMWLCAVLSITGRLLCNLFDGMVAVEGGKKTASGEIFNDFPDRLSDPIILIAAGYSIHSLPYADVLGWSAAIGSILTAYVRYLGASCGVGQNFCGPMAKQHRMAVISVALLVSTVFNAAAWQPWVIYGGLCLIIAGCVLTVVRRLASTVRKLEESSEGS